MLEWAISLIHWKHRLNVTDKSNWGYRCSKCEKQHELPIWHKLPYGCKV